MSDNNDLPPWLRDEDDDEQNRAPSGGSDDLPSWLQDDPPDESSGDDLGSLDWETPSSATGDPNTDQFSLRGMTGELPWMQGVSDENDRPATGDLPNLEWETSSTGAPDTGETLPRGVTAELPW